MLEKAGTNSHCFSSGKSHDVQDELNRRHNENSPVCATTCIFHSIGWLWDIPARRKPRCPSPRAPTSTHPGNSARFRQSASSINAKLLARLSSALEDKFSGLAKEELAKILSVDASQITVVAITEMTWPNSSLGCPAPGVVYAQGRVPGYRIVLGIGDVLYTYHSDLVGQVLSCPSGDVREELPMGPTTAPEIGVPIK